MDPDRFGVLAIGHVGTGGSSQVAWRWAQLSFQDEFYCPFFCKFDFNVERREGGGNKFQFAIMIIMCETIGLAGARMCSLSSYRPQPLTRPSTSARAS